MGREFAAVREFFKADEVLANESVETDAPGIRIRCTLQTGG